MRISIDGCTDERVCDNLYLLIQLTILTEVQNAFNFVDSVDHAPPRWPNAAWLVRKIINHWLVFIVEFKVDHNIIN